MIMRARKPAQALYATVLDDRNTFIGVIVRRAEGQWVNMPIPDLPYGAGVPYGPFATFDAARDAFFTKACSK